MTELKTKPTDKNVNEFLSKVENQRRRDDSFEILKLMREFTQVELFDDAFINMFKV